MLCRVADDVFWMSRYVERAIAVSRLIDVTWHLDLDAGDLVNAGARNWMPLIGLPSPSTEAPTADARVREGNGRSAAPPEHDATPAGVRSYLSLDTNNPNSLVSCIRQARGAAQRVRESISSEMWEQINQLYLALAAPQSAGDAPRDPIAFYRQVREGAQFIQGLADSTLAHDEPWNFICLGTYLERADNVARLLNLQTHLLSLDPDPSGESAVRWLAVLRSCGCAEAYASHYSLRVEPASVVEFILLNPRFPQALRFSLVAAHAALQEIAQHAGSRPDDPATRAMGRLWARLENIEVDEVIEEGLSSLLIDTRQRIGEVVELVTHTYLRGEEEPPRRVGVARAAMIMAAAQQQQ